MGTSGMDWHQWKKYGSCIDFFAKAYFEQSRGAYSKIVRSGIFRRLKDPVKLKAKIVAAAVLKANMRLWDQMCCVTSKKCCILLVQICLNKDLSYRFFVPSMGSNCLETFVFPIFPKAYRLGVFT